jgi:hypothetical protein
MIPAPSTHHELNKALDYVTENWEPVDKLYIGRGDADAYRFCRWRYAFLEEDLVTEPIPPGTEQDETAFFEDKVPEFREAGRVWFTLAFDFPYLIEPFLERVESHAVRVDEQHMVGASAYLYDFGVSVE